MYYFDTLAEGVIRLDVLLTLEVALRDTMLPRHSVSVVDEFYKLR